MKRTKRRRASKWAPCRDERVLAGGRLFRGSGCTLQGNGGGEDISVCGGRVMWGKGGWRRVAVAS